MSRFTRQMKSYWQQLCDVVRNETGAIFHDEGVLLIMVLAPLIYATVYSSAYGSEVLRDVPIGVIDECRTPASRSVIDAFDAGPNTYVAYEPTDMQEARELFYARRIYGIVYIPERYEEQLLAGGQAVVPLYVDGSYLLMYRQVFQEVVTALSRTGAAVEFQRLLARGADIPQAQAVTQPVIYQAHNLFNPYLGYGAFVMPAVLILILQQTLLIGIGMIGGTWREQGLYGKLCPADRRRMSTLPIIAGKALVYGAIYAMTSLYLFALHYRIFHYPDNGTAGSVAALLVPYLLASICLGIALSTLFRYRENSLLLLLWTSIPLLMISGVSLPEQALPGWLYDFGKIFPSSHGIGAFIRIRSMGATTADVLPEIRALWMQVVIYGALACLGMHRLLCRESAARR